MKKWVALSVALILLLTAAGVAQASIPAEANIIGQELVALCYDDRVIVGKLDGVAFDEGRNLMGVSFYCPDLKDHLKVEFVGAEPTIAAPIYAFIRTGVELLLPVESTFSETVATWYFLTVEMPETVTIYAYGDDTAYVVDAASGLIEGMQGVTYTGSESQSDPNPVLDADPDSQPEDPDPLSNPESVDHIDSWEIVGTLFPELAAASKDPWEQAIYNESPGYMEHSADTLILKLRSFDPKLKTLPKYENGKQAWWDGFFENVSAYDLEITLNLVDGMPDQKSVKALKNAVNKAAKAAQSGFNQKAVREALADLLFPKPVVKDAEASGLNAVLPDYAALVDNNPAFSGLDAYALTPLFYAQSKQALNVKGGPHALIFTLTGANPMGLIEDARKVTTERLSKIYKANDMHWTAIKDEFFTDLGQKAVALRKKGGEARAFTLDIDALIAGDFGAEYVDYVQSFNTEAALDRLIGDVAAMPDAPAQPFPKDGRISGSKSGTKVIIKTPNDGNARYIQMRNAYTDAMTVELFARSGKSITVNVPEGDYYLLIAAGETWYGMEGLFGDSGYYTETAKTDVPSKKYYVTLTLGVSDGNVGTYSANPSSFKK